MREAFRVTDALGRVRWIEREVPAESEPRPGSTIYVSHDIGEIST